MSNSKSSANRDLTAPCTDYQVSMATVELLPRFCVRNEPMAAPSGVLVKSQLISLTVEWISLFGSGSRTIKQLIFGSRIARLQHLLGDFGSVIECWILVSASRCEKKWMDMDPTHRDVLVMNLFL